MSADNHEHGVTGLADQQIRGGSVCHQGLGLDVGVLLPERREDRLKVTVEPRRVPSAGVVPEDEIVVQMRDPPTLDQPHSGVGPTGFVECLAHHVI
ncbi:MAG: hypothetical protein JWN91_570 [Nocardioides sp.]|nr:hypothetical protein [Nocardioides sp.]